jgi:lantibiotic biosynthesis protein
MTNAQTQANTAMATDKKLFLETAWSIGCKLMQEAIWHNDKCTWQGYWIEPVNGAYIPVMRTFAADIYSGTSGMALFFHALYNETRDPLVLSTLEGAINQSRQIMHAAPDYGYYSGKAGIAAMLLKTGHTLQREDWVSEGLDLLETIPTEQLHPYQTDVISGAAGTIPVLLDAYQHHKKDFLLQKASALGDLLCNNAVKQNGTWSWATVPSKHNLTGFSHGSSGMALALLQLNKHTGNTRYLEGAQAGFLYEHRNFDHGQQNWPDYREDVPNQAPGTYHCGMAWCHGAPGIAISRAAAGRIHHDTLLVQELQVALNTTSNNIYQVMAADLMNTNFSLCHGIAGNADIIMESGSKEHCALAEAVGIAGYHKYHTNGSAWPSGLNTSQQTPGLMMGLAGTGYFYLRLYNPANHATVLLPGLTPPHG